MWNSVTYNKAPSEKLRDHQNHIQRIFEIKPRIKINEPKKPTFLFTGKSDCESGRFNINNIEKIIKINYENGLIMKKIVEHELNHSPYHPSQMKHYECPPFYRKTYSQIRNLNEKKIKSENLKLNKRLLCAKTLYPTKSILKDFEKQKIYEKLRVSKIQIHNPNLFFETPMKVYLKIKQSINLPILIQNAIHK